MTHGILHGRPDYPVFVLENSCWGALLLISHSNCGADIPRRLFEPNKWPRSARIGCVAACRGYFSTISEAKPHRSGAICLFGADYQYVLEAIEPKKNLRSISCPDIAPGICCDRHYPSGRLLQSFLMLSCTYVTGRNRHIDRDFSNPYSQN